MGGLIHPWAVAVGAVAAMLPVAIHFLTRPKPVRMPLSTVRFVQRAIQQRRARHRLRDFLILAFRTIAVFMLALAIARPLIGEQPLVAANETAKINRVVMLDVSASMAAQHGGIQLFERARTVAARYLSDGADHRMNLIVAGAAAKAAFPRLTNNVAALRDEIAKVQARPERLNVAAALNLASETLRLANDGTPSELVIISDLQRTNWAAADFAILPADTRIQLESVAPNEPLANLAILRATPVGRAEIGRDLRLEIEVGNYSSTPRNVRVEISLGDASGSVQGVCAAGGTATLTVAVPVRSAGWLTGSARLAGVSDALAEDNSRPIAVEVRPPPVFLLMSRQPADSRSSSSYFLERALAPFAPRPGRIVPKVSRIDPARLEREAAGDAELFVLDHPGRLSAEVTRLLATLVRRGRGLLYVAAEPQDATNLKLLADAAGADVHLPVEFVPPPALQRRRDLFLTELRRSSPPWSVFGESLSAVTGSLRFSGGLATHRLEGALADDIVATLSDRSAALVVSPCGSGNIAVLNADLAASNLPSSPAFVPLVGELADLLLYGRRAVGNSVVGEPLVGILPASIGSAAGLHTSSSDGAEIGKLSEENGGVIWRCPAAPTPGIYSVKRNEQTIFAAAVGVPPEESDLRTISHTVLLDRLGGDRAVSFRSAVADSSEDHDRVWVWFAVACVGCLLGEIMTLRLFRT